MIQEIYDILGLEALSANEETLILIFTLVLLFFGSLCVLNGVLSLISSLFNTER